MKQVWLVWIQPPSEFESPDLDEIYEDEEEANEFCRKYNTNHVETSWVATVEGREIKEKNEIR